VDRLLPFGTVAKSFTSAVNALEYAQRQGVNTPRHQAGNILMQNEGDIKIADLARR